MAIKVSIVTCCYNSSDTFPDTLNSVKRLFESDLGGYFEFLVIDSSNNNKIKTQVSESDAKHAYYFTPRAGIYSAMNFGAKKARGEYLWFLNSDDWIDWDSTDLKKLSTYLDKDFKLFFGRVNWIDPVKNKLVGRSRFNPLFFLSHLACFPPHPSTLVNRKLFLKYNGFDQGYKISADYDFFLSLVKKENITVDKELYCDALVINMRTGGASSDGLRTQLLKVFEDYKALKKNKFFILLLILKRVCRVYFKFFIK